MIFVVSVPAFSADHTVDMLSSSDGQMMVFKPAVLKINPGDTVTWKATNPGHNTASINEMSPDSSLHWDGKINEELKITCQPVAINSGYTWPKHGKKNSNKTLIVSILKPIEAGLPKEKFIKILENKIYSELNLLD